jgi:hypothetical protein
LPFNEIFYKIVLFTFYITIFAKHDKTQKYLHAIPTCADWNQPKSGKVQQANDAINL